MFFLHNKPLAVILSFSRNQKKTSCLGWTLDLHNQEYAGWTANVSLKCLYAFDNEKKGDPQICPQTLNSFAFALFSNASSRIISWAKPCPDNGNWKASRIFYICLASWTLTDFFLAKEQSSGKLWLGTIEFQRSDHSKQVLPSCKATDANPL